MTASASSRSADADRGSFAPLPADRVRQFFEPTSVAVVGARETFGWSSRLVANVRAFGPKHSVSMVHPSRDELWGQPVVPRLQDLEKVPDLAFVLAPSSALPSILDDAHEAGTRNLVILASDLGVDRASLAELVARARERDQVLLGPNCIGFINHAADAGPFAGSAPRPQISGSAAFVLQSGAISFGVNHYAQARGVGISFLCTTGNEVMVTAEDALEYAVTSEHTTAVGLFIEQIRDPEHFEAAALAALEMGKPIVALKVGRSAKAREIAAAHTGAIAGADEVISTFLERVGVVRVDTLEQLVSTVGLMAHHHATLPNGRAMHVVAGSGGACGIIADRAPSLGLELPEFSPQLVDRLQTVLPDDAVAANPLDVTGKARTSARGTFRVDDALELVSEDAAADFIFYMATASPTTEDEDSPVARRRWDAVAEIVRAAPRPVIMWDYANCDITPYQREFFAERDLHLCGGIEESMEAVARTVQWGERRSAALGRPRRLKWNNGSTLKTGRTTSWSEHRARAFLSGWDVPVVPGELATSPAEATTIAERLGGRVAVKVCSADITHKSDVGGVELGLEPESVSDAYIRVLAAARQQAPDAEIEGVLVTQMRTDFTTELFVGVTVDRSYGPILAVGLGGIWIEILADTQLSLLPVDGATVLDMLGRLKGAPLLSGARGTSPVDLHRLADVVVQVTDAALALGPSLDTLEINPLACFGDRVEALDVVVMTKDAGA